MSLYVTLEVKIEEYQAKRKGAIRKSLRQSWGFKNINEEGKQKLVAIHGGQYDRDPVSHESMRRIAEGVWEANGGYCKISILITHLHARLFRKKDYTTWRASLN